MLVVRGCCFVAEKCEGSPKIVVEQFAENYCWKIRRKLSLENSSKIVVGKFVENCRWKISRNTGGVHLVTGVKLNRDTPKFEKTLPMTFVLTLDVIKFFL